MSFDELLDTLWLFDFEVTKYDWLLVLINYRTNEEIVFHNSIPNEVQNFIDIKNPILIGHNARYYDQYILKAILCGYTPEEVKEVNDHIINGGQGFEINFGQVETPPIWDTIQDIVPQKSLKEIEANLLLDITESTVDFNIDHKWTQQEYDEMLYYCRADVKALRPLFDARKDYFETKYDICKLCNIDPKFNVGLTNAKLCAKFLEAEYVERDDERDYKIPSSIDNDVIDDRILNFFNRIHDNSISSEELFKSKLEFIEHDMPTVVSWGGKHGAISNYKFDSKENQNVVLINCDFASLYPHLLALPQYNFISRNIQDKGKYFDTLKKRLELKKQGKKKEQLALKLILNTTYGCELNKYNNLFDARNARSTCITGQLLISELTEKVYAIGDVKLVQVNTDGLMVEISKNKLDDYYKVCNDFSNKCGIELEFDVIDKIYQRDVNNYIMLYGTSEYKSIKAKGGCFGSLPKLTVEKDGSITSEYKINFKNNTLAIVSEALARYLILDTPIEDTINSCDNVNMFQIVSHLGSTYQKCVQESEKGDIELQKNNRIYAGLKPSGSIIKIKPNGRRDSLANQPINPLIDNGNKCTILDINKEWYIDLTKQWAEDFLGVKRLENYKKDELLELAKELNIDVDKKTKKDKLIEIIKKVKRGGNQMATKQELEEKLEKSAEQNEKLIEKMKEDPNRSLYHKINAFRNAIRKREFIFDEELPNNLGGKEYYNVDQFYNAIQDACIEVGLDFSFELVEIISFEKELVKPSGKLPIHVATVRSIAKLTDIDTGLSKEYTTIGQGSDTIDKAISGANTSAFRQWFYKNFTPKNMDEEEFDKKEEVVKSEAPKVTVYVPETKKEEIKKEVVAQVQQESTDDDIKTICENIMKIRAVGVDADGKDLSNYGAKTLEELMSGKLSDVEIMEKDLKVKNKMEKVGL